MKEINEKVENVVLAFGKKGIDLTIKTINILIEQNLGLTIKAIIESEEDYEKISKIMDSNDWLKKKVGISFNTSIDYFAKKSDFGICSLSWEFIQLARLGLPIIYIANTKKERNFGKKLLHNHSIFEFHIDINALYSIHDYNLQEYFDLETRKLVSRNAIQDMNLYTLSNLEYEKFIAFINT